MYNKKEPHSNLFLKYATTNQDDVYCYYCDCVTIKLHCLYCRYLLEYSRQHKIKNTQHFAHFYPDCILIK